MYDPYGYGGPRRMQPRPNFALRRLVAVVGALVILLILYSAFSRVFGGGDENAATTTTTTASSPQTTVVRTPPLCVIGDVQTSFGLAENWFRTIVDTELLMPVDFVPPDLVPASAANYAAEFRIRELLANDLNLMRNAILNAQIPEVALIAAYRSIDQQADLFSRREAALGFEAAVDGTARPGHSEHQLGTAIDVRLIGQTDVDQSFGETTTGRWLEINSWRYGFILSYPKDAEALSCYKYEPWHFRYVGIELAGEVYASGLTLREFLFHWEVTGAKPAGPGRNAAGIPNPTTTTTTTSTTTIAGG